MNDNKSIMIRNKEEFSIEEILLKEKSTQPFVDVMESDVEFTLFANMPGVNREDIKIKLSDNSLILFGRVNYNKLSDKKFILKEIADGNYFRNFKLAATIDKNKIEALFEHGQLIIKLPKSENSKPRIIPIP